VLVTTNMFGDILSDERAGPVGGRGPAPGANGGETAALFEAVHGSTPDVAGRGIANPTALLAASMPVDHLGARETAARVRTAVVRAPRDDRIRRRDLGGHATTNELAVAVVRRLA
jgi:isocitrate dehydrogenase (NAD+)